MSQEAMKLATLCLHGGQTPDPTTNSRTVHGPRHVLTTSTLEGADP